MSAHLPVLTGQRESAEWCLPAPQSPERVPTISCSSSRCLKISIGISFTFQALFKLLLLHWVLGRVRPHASLLFIYVCMYECIFKLIFIGVQLPYNVVLVSAVQQSESVICILYPLFFRFPSHLGHHRSLSRVPCAIHQALISYLFYTQQCIYVKPFERRISVHFNCRLKKNAQPKS